jgi:hypothetical protein
MKRDYFPKVIELEEVTSHSEPTVQIVRPHEFNKLAHVKAASEALDYIKDIKPEPGKTIILVLAMTAGEIYGANRNGDAFHASPVRAGPVLLTEEEGLRHHYKTFETNAHCFRHHANRDPEKKIGDVLKAFYNEHMHRVELLLAIEHARAADVIEQIERGEFPAVSMGTKVAYDVCALCGNKAPSRAQYCDHAKYQLGELLPNGKRIFVWNPKPKFFDISIVRRPADRLGFMMKKVAEAVPEFHSGAELGEHYEDASHKIADLGKLSIISKILNGGIAAAKDSGGETHELKQFADNVAMPAAQRMPPLADSDIRQMLQYRPAEVLATLSSMGIMLTTPEFLKFFVWKAAPDLEIPADMLGRAVGLQAQIFRLLADSPQLLDEISETGYLDESPENVNLVLAKKLEPLVEKRSQTRDWLYKRALHPAYDYSGSGGPAPGVYYPGMTELVSATDPQTGRQHQTTMAAVKRTQGIARRRQAGHLLGGGALLAGAAALLPGPLRALSPLLAGSGTQQLGRLSDYQTVPSDHPNAPIYRKVRPRQNDIWSGSGFAGTELAEKQSSYEGLDVTSAAIKLAMDVLHQKRQRNQKIALLLDGDELTFDQAAQKIGDAIFL